MDTGRIILRDYQEEATQALFDYFFKNPKGNPLIIAPTGAGKSILVAEFIKRLLTTWPEQKYRILLLTHVKELIQQNYEKLKTIWPAAPAGIYSAGLGKKQAGHQIVFGGIQSVSRNKKKLGRFNIVIVDECHMIPKTGMGQYRSYFDYAEELNPNLRVVGYTATPFRLSGGYLTQGKDKVFDSAAYTIEVSKLIEDGYLSTLTTQASANQYDTKGLKVYAGDFQKGALAELVDDDRKNQLIAQEIASKGADRLGWLVFCSSVKHAYSMRDNLRELGVSCETVTGDLDKGQRANILKRYKAGQIRCLTNCDVLTTGFDAPHTDLIAMCRPTKSAGLYIQIIGRGCRTSPGKANCLVLDYGGNIARHGPIDKIKVKSKTKGDGGAPVKLCPKCMFECHAGVKDCPTCGFPFPPPKNKLKTRAARGRIISIKQNELVPVTKVTYKMHCKPNSHPTMRVDYENDVGKIATEWVPFEHSGHARDMAVAWWMARSNQPPPSKTADALKISRGLKVPTHITVEMTDSGYTKPGKYFWRTNAE